MTLFDIVQKIEVCAQEKQYEITHLQEFRKKFKHLNRLPVKTIFATKSVNEEEGWAFHCGGRTEIQFNIGFEEKGSTLRYGIAFSLDPSQALPDVSILYSKIDLFNEWLRQNNDQVADLRMWYYKGRIRSENYRPMPISDELKHPGVFIFLGYSDLIQNIDDNIECVLVLFDRLLPLYRYVESTTTEDRFPPPPRKLFFREGCPNRKISTSMNLSKHETYVSLRHNVLQKQLYEIIKDQYVKSGTEGRTPTGSIDVWGENQDGTKDYYEIKTYSSAQACIREAIPQLLEYSYWPGSCTARKLFIVGEAELDFTAKKYLERLCEKFNLPLIYYRIRMQ